MLLTPCLAIVMIILDIKKLGFGSIENQNTYNGKYRCFCAIIKKELEH